MGPQHGMAVVIVMIVVITLPELIWDNMDESGTNEKKNVRFKKSMQ